MGKYVSLMIEHFAAPHDFFDPLNLSVRQP
jgi:hypothetical protein